jgi:hypothetical protein
MTTRRRGMSPLLIAAAALLLGAIAYGFTASAGVPTTGTPPIAGGQGQATAIAFDILANSISYGNLNGAGQVDTVSFTATTAQATSSGVQVWAKLLNDNTTSYTDCTPQLSGAGTTSLTITSCVISATNINDANFGLDVVVMD